MIEKLKKLVKKLLQNDEQIIIIRDFNVRIGEW